MTPIPSSPFSRISIRDSSLCLHVPEDWNSGLFIADSIVPWTYEWLYFYEIWLATGEWCGGGTEHSPSDKGRK